jgi:uncharacterized alkaline shock family protein YloU
VSRDHLALDGPSGRIELTGAAVTSVVVRAAESVQGVRVRRPRRGLAVAIDGTGAEVAVGLTGPLEGVLPDVGEAVQQAIAAALGSMTGLTVSVDVAFEELA